MMMMMMMMMMMRHRNGSERFTGERLIGSIPIFDFFSRNLEKIKLIQNYKNFTE